MKFLEETKKGMPLPWAHIYPIWTRFRLDSKRERPATFSTRIASNSSDAHHCTRTTWLTFKRNGTKLVTKKASS